MNAPEVSRRPASAADGAGSGHGPILLVDILGGTNDFGMELATALARQVAVTVLTAVSAPLSDVAGLRLVRTFPEYWGPRNKFAKALQMLRAILRLTLEVWRHRSTAVHVQFFRLQFVDPAVYLLLRPFVRRLVYTAHNALPHEPRWWHRSFYKAWYTLPDRIHVLSEYTRDRLVSELGVPASKITVVPHGNYESLASRFASSVPPDRDKLGIPPTATVILFFGLIRPYKGVDRLIRAVAAVPKDVPVFLVVAGGGSAAALDEVRRALMAHQLTERSLFDARFIPEGELVGYLKMADVVALPYSHIYQSGALLLAMTFGKAIIASDIRGFREYVVDGCNAVLCATEDRDAFANCIAQLAQDPERRRRIGEAARITASTDYSWDSIAGKVAELYE